MFNYLLTYNPYLGTPTENQLLNHVRINRFVSQYYQPYPGTYLLKSEQQAAVINDSFSGFFEGSPYMLVLYSAPYSGGKLPPEIWQWVNTGAVPTANALQPTLFPRGSLAEAIQNAGRLPPK